MFGILDCFLIVFFVFNFINKRVNFYYQIFFILGTLNIQVVLSLFDLDNYSEFYTLNELFLSIGIKNIITFTGFKCFTLILFAHYVIKPATV